MLRDPCLHRNAYARIIRLQPRIHGDRPAYLEIHERFAYRAVGILGELLMPFSFGKSDLQIASLREGFERAAVGCGVGLSVRGTVVGSGNGGSYGGVVGSVAPRSDEPHGPHSRRSHVRQAMIARPDGHGATIQRATGPRYWSSQESTSFTTCVRLTITSCAAS